MGWRRESVPVHGSMFVLMAVGLWLRSCGWSDAVFFGPTALPVTSSGQGVTLPYPPDCSQYHTRQILYFGVDRDTRSIQASAYDTVAHTWGSLPQSSQSPAVPPAASGRLFVSPVVPDTTRMDPSTGCRSLNNGGVHPFDAGILVGTVLGMYRFDLRTLTYSTAAVLGVPSDADRLFGVFAYNTTHMFVLSTGNMQAYWLTIPVDPTLDTGLPWSLSGPIVAVTPPNGPPFTLGGVGSGAAFGIGSGPAGAGARRLYVFPGNVNVASRMYYLDVDANGSTVTWLVGADPPYPPGTISGWRPAVSGPQLIVYNDGQDISAQPRLMVFDTALQAWTVALVIGTSADSVPIQSPGIFTVYPTVASGVESGAALLVSFQFTVPLPLTANSRLTAFRAVSPSPPITVPPARQPFPDLSAAVRLQASAAADSAVITLNHAILFGGLRPVPGVGAVPTNETILFDITTLNYTTLNVAPDPVAGSPPPTAGHTFVAALPALPLLPASGVDMFLFGGSIARSQHEVPVNTTWRLSTRLNADGRGWSQFQWRLVNPIDPSAVPPGRLGHTATYLPATNSILVFGGLCVSYIDTPVRPCPSDVYLYAIDTNQWTNVSYTLDPSALGSGGVTFERARHTAVLIGQSVYITGGNGVATPSCLGSAQLANDGILVLDTVTWGVRRLLPHLSVPQLCGHSASLIGSRTMTVVQNRVSDVGVDLYTFDVESLRFGHEYGGTNPVTSDFTTLATDSRLLLLDYYGTTIIWTGIFRVRIAPAAAGGNNFGCLSAPDQNPCAQLSTTYGMYSSTYSTFVPVQSGAYTRAGVAATYDLSAFAALGVPFSVAQIDSALFSLVLTVPFTLTGRPMSASPLRRLSLADQPLIDCTPPASSILTPEACLVVGASALVVDSFVFSDLAIVNAQFGAMAIGSRAVVSFVRVSAVNNSNSASGNGGAVWIVESSSLDVSDCLFESNLAQFGGAVASHSSTLNVARTVFRGKGLSAGQGGAVAVLGTTLSMRDSLCELHSEALSGGCVFAFYSLLGFVNCTFQWNDAAQGGALFISGTSTASLQRCTIAHNNATNGGGVYVDLSILQIVGSAFSYNGASHGQQIGFGGGLYAASSTLEADALTRFTANRNPKGGGGAIYADSMPNVDPATADGGSNTAAYGPFRAGPPAALEWVNTTATRLAQTTGQPITPPLVLRVKDEYGQTVTIDQTTTVLAVQSNAFTAGGVTVASGGICTFDTAVLAGPPGVQLQLTFRSTSNLNLALPDTLSVAACVANQFIQQVTGVCTYCDPGKAMNADGRGCTACPPGFENPNPELSPNCTICAAGFWAQSSGTAQCVLCAAFTDPTHTACQTCTTPGFVPDRVRVVCVPCTPGTYADTNLGLCASCPAGRATNATAATQCDSCGPGTAASGTGRTSCDGCTAGRYSQDVSNSACGLCATGRFSNSTAATACSACPVGTYKDSAGTGVCTACALGLIAPSPGSPACSLCPAGSAADSLASRCIGCGDGLSCTAGFRSVLPDYWLADVSVAAANASSAASDSPVVQTAYLCAPDHCAGGLGAGACFENRLQPVGANPLCAHCAAGYSEWSNACIRCEGTNGGIVFLILLLSAVATAVLYHLSQDSSDASVQIALYFVATLRVITNGQRAYLSWIGLFDFTPFSLPVQLCPFAISPVGAIVGSLLSPFIYVGWLLLASVVHAGWSRYSRARRALMLPESMSCLDRYVVVSESNEFRVRRYMRAAVTILLSAYTAVTTAVFDALNCTDYVSSTDPSAAPIRVVFAYPAVSCSDASYHAVLVLVYLLLLIFVFGIPIGIIGVVLSLRRRLQLTAATAARPPLDGWLSWFASVFALYQPRFDWWSVVAVLRRAVVAAIGLGLAGSSFERQRLYCVCCALFCVVHALAQPMQHARDNRFEFGTLFGLCVASLLALKPTQSASAPLPVASQVLITAIAIAVLIVFVVIKVIPSTKSALRTLRALRVPLLSDSSAATSSAATAATSINAAVPRDFDTDSLASAESATATGILLTDIGVDNKHERD